MVYGTPVVMVALAGPWSSPSSTAFIADKLLPTCCASSPVEQYPVHELCLPAHPSADAAASASIQMPGCAVHDHRSGGIRLFPHLRRVKKDAAADSFLYTANVARNQRRSRSGVQDIKAACSVGTGSAPETSRRVLRCDSAAAAY